MIPFPNVIAGILIGVANETWSALFIIPFVWGIAYCIYVLFTKKEELNMFIEQAKINNRKGKWGMSHKQEFYFVEYTTASFTSLVFSLISGILRLFI